MNAIVVLCDTLRRDHCGPYSRGRPLDQCWSDEQPSWTVPTPNMDRLAARGTVFDRAWCGSTPCMPARRDIYTGRFEFLERGWGPLEDGDLDLPTQVSGPHHRAVHKSLEAGYKVSQLVTDHMCLWSKGSGNYHFGYTGYEAVRGHQWDNWLTDPGIDFGIAAADRDGQFDRHFRNVQQLRQERGEDGWFAPRVFSQAAEWLERNHTYEDFFLHIDCFDPHEPWDPPRELVEPFMPDAYEVEGWSCHPPYCRWEEQLTPEQFESFRARYAGMVTLVDRALGKLLDAMDRLDLWQNTLLIFTTDHGTWNGERGRIGKLGTHQFDGCAHIPFIACHPEWGCGERRAQLVQLVDIYPTVLAALGLPVPEERHGVDLLPVLADEDAATREYALTGMFGQSVSITDGEWILHQAPAVDNGPLYWYGLQGWHFVKNGDLGPAVRGRREVRGQSYRFAEPTWLSDKRVDPCEKINLATSEAGKLEEMQRALKHVLLQVGAPNEQIDRLGLRHIRY